MNDRDVIEGLQRSLREAEERLARVAAMHSPQMGSFEFEARDDGELIFTGADETASLLVTVARPGFFGQPLLQVFTGMAGTDLPGQLLRTAREGTPVGLCSYVPPGTRLGTAFSLFAFQSAPGRVTMKFWRSADHFAADEIARRNRDLLAQVFEQSPVAVALLESGTGRIVDVNNECTRLSGLAREQMLGRRLQEIGLRADQVGASGDEDLPHLVAPLRDRAVDLVRPDGRVAHLSLHAAAVQLGSSPRVLVYLVDVTDRAEAQRALARMNAGLEARVAQRTLELAQARDAAERANRAKSDFLSGMSHELRTPLNAILGFSQLLAVDTVEPLPPRHRGHVRQIRRAGAHLLELVNEVLDLARLEAGQLRISLEPVDLPPLLLECLTLMRPIALEHEIDLMARPPTACAVHVQADRTRLRQVLLNLLSNAIKYNRERGRVWLDCQEDADGVRVGVHDDGPGLSAEQQQRLFREFERLDADREPIEGTGIGLALSRRLMQLMDGRIGVASQPGGGSNFWIHLRRSPVAPQPAPPPAAEAPRPASGDTAARRSTVLYVEDNPVNVVLMEAMLAHRPGVQVVSAGLPGLGLDLARSAPPDLILLDIQLPGMDGYEFLRRLRRHARTRQVPVVAVSANAMPADIERGLAAGFARYLPKPLDLETVLATVDDLLGP